MHETIIPLTPLWWKGIVISLLVISLILLFFNRASSAWKLRFTKLLAYSSILVYISTTIIAISAKEWNTQDFLPLHLCNISYFICILVLLSKKQWMYEWALLLAMPSAFNALITPELIWGSNNWHIFEYYFTHAILILVPLYLMFVMNYKLRILSWWKIFLKAQIVFLIVFTFNFILDTNYMFLLSKPLVNNPFIIGDWPFYILFVQLIGLLHIVLIYKLSPKYIE